MATSAVQKICTKCNGEYQISSFHKDSSKPDGYHPWCKSCRLENSRNRRGITPDRFFARNRRHDFKPMAGKASARWYQAHAEVERKKAKIKRDANPEAHRAANKRWRENNLEMARSRVLKYQRENIGLMAAYAAKRRACKLLSTPVWANKFFITETYRFAKLKSKMLGSEWVVDHIVPLKSKTVCGLHVEHNLRVIPAAVNASKGNRYWPDMPNGGHHRY
mgnify:CR=1 FL=1